MEALAKKIESLLNESRYDKACKVLKNKLGFQFNINNVEFKSMPWDKDKQKRNVFNCELIRGDKNYSFEFGFSVAESCEYVSEIETLDFEKDKIKFYAGLESNKINVGTTFHLTLKEVEDLSSDFITSKADALKLDFDQKVRNYNEQISKKFAKEYLRSNSVLYLNSPKDNGMFVQCVQKAIKRTLNTLKENKVLSKNKKLEGNAKEPSLYEVLACLQKYPVGDFEEFCSLFGYDEDSREAERTFNAVHKEYEGLSSLFTTEELELLDLIN